MFASKYGWSKSQIDEVYPDEARVLIQMIALESEDEKLLAAIERNGMYVQFINVIHAAKPDQVARTLINNINKLLFQLNAPYRAGMKPSTEPSEDDLPDFARLSQLQEQREADLSKSRGLRNG